MSSSMYSSIYARIEALEPKLHRLAWQFQTQEQAPEDIHQAMMLHLLERDQADPTFSQQNDSYLLDAGRKYVGYAAVHAQEQRSRHILEEATPETDMDDLIESLADSTYDPAVVYAQMESALEVAQALQHLSKQERGVLTMVVAGIRGKDIAQALAVSAAAVSVCKRRIIDKVRAEVTK